MNTPSTRRGLVRAAAGAALAAALVAPGLAGAATPMYAVDASASAVVNVDVFVSISNYNSNTNLNSNSSTSSSSSAGRPVDLERSVMGPKAASRNLAMAKALHRQRLMARQRGARAHKRLRHLAVSHPRAASAGRHR